MNSALERILVLSFRLLKTASNQKISLEEKGRRLQTLSAAQKQGLIALDAPAMQSTIADTTRGSLIRYLGKVTEAKIREQL